jgi:hypothetical protein
VVLRGESRSVPGYVSNSWWLRSGCRQPKQSKFQSFSRACSFRIQHDGRRLQRRLNTRSSQRTWPRARGEKAKGSRLRDLNGPRSHDAAGRCSYVSCYVRPRMPAPRPRPRGGTNPSSTFWGVVCVAGRGAWFVIDIIITGRFVLSTLYR